MSDLSSGKIKVVTESRCACRITYGTAAGCGWCGGTGLHYVATGRLNPTKFIRTFMDEDERDMLVADSWEEEE